MSTSGPVLIRELNDREKLCLVCTVPGGCDEEHPLCGFKKQNKAGQRRGAVIQHLQAEGEVSSSHFAQLWGEDQRYVSSRIMKPLKDKGYIERANGDGKQARWRLPNG